jgi:predicted CDP-diglyceride synthetase/phosphatidate cytidylyltransferase
VPTDSFAQHHTLLLTTGIAVVLALASIIGVGLKITVAKRQPHSRHRQPQYARQCVVGICIAVGLALVAGRIGVAVLFAFASFVALREFVAPRPQRPSERALLGAASLAFCRFNTSSWRAETMRCPCCSSPLSLSSRCRQ